MAGSIDVHFHPERASVQGTIGGISGTDVGGNPPGVLHEVNGPGIAGTIVKELKPIPIPRARIISKHNAAKISAVDVFTHGDLHGPWAAGGLIVKEEVIDPVTPTAYGNTRATGPPPRKAQLVEGIGPSLPPKRDRIPGKVKGDRTLRNGVTTVLGDQGLLPEGRLGVLGVQVKTPFDALSSGVEIGPQLIVPDPIALGVIDTVVDPRRAAPNGRSAIIPRPRIGHRTRTPTLDLVLIPIDRGIVTADTATQCPITKRRGSTVQP